MTVSTTASFGDDNAALLKKMEPEQYLACLEYLVAQGQGIGKTKSVAAYYFDPTAFFRRQGGAEDWLDDESGAEKLQQIEAKPLYIIFDLALWPEGNEYGRQLGVKKIFEALADRLLHEEDINSTTFEAPGVWTSRKIDTFEEDYTRRNVKDDFTGKRSRIWDPNPEAYRVAAKITDAAVLPVSWGSYPVEDGSTLVLREKDVAAISLAIRSIKVENVSIEDALFERSENGTLVTKFDVYAMDPGFSSANYSLVGLNQTTKEIQASLREAGIGIHKPELLDDLER